MRQELKGHNGINLSLAVLPNGDLVSGGEDGTIKVWDTNDGKVKKSLSCSGRLNDIIAVHNDCIISASDDMFMNIKIWNINEGTVKRTVTGHIKSVLALKMLKNGVFASGSCDTTIKIWNTSDGGLKKP